MKYKIISLLSIAFFATYPTISKVVLENNSPFVVIFITSMVSALVVWFFYGIVPELKKFIRLKNLNMYLFIMAICAGAIAPAFNLFGLAHASVLSLVLLNTLQTPIAIFLSIFILKERVGINYVIALIFLFFGITIYSTEFFQVFFQFTWNDLYFVAAATFFALSDVTYKSKLSHIPHELILIGRNFIGGAIILGLMLFMGLESWLVVSFDQNSLIGMGLIILIPILLAQACWYTSLEKLKNVEIAFFVSLYPIFAAAIALGVLGESIYWYQIVGGIIMIIGLIISHMHFGKQHVHQNHIRLQSFKSH